MSYFLTMASPTKLYHVIAITLIIRERDHYLISIASLCEIRRDSCYLKGFDQENCFFFQVGLTLFLYKQLVYKQLVLGWEIAEQFSGLNFFSLSNNKNYRLRKSKVFPS